MVFLFYGPNTFAMRRKLSEMIDTYKKKAGSDFGLERVDGAAISPESLHGLLTATPMFASSRLVIIEQISANKTVAEKALKLLDQVPESTVAVFVEPVIDQRTSFFKELLKAAKPAKFEKLQPHQLSAWVAQQAARFGAQIEPRATSLLIEMVGDDQWRLEQEVMKLANYNPAITAENVRELVEPGYHQTIFDLVDAIVAGRLKQALETYRGLLAAKTNEIYILTMIIWQLRNLLLAKAAGKVTAAELSKRAGISPYVAGKAITSSSRYSYEVLKAAFQAAVETDYLIKSGEGEGEVLVEQLICRLAAARPGS
jgi:DNA polymerase III subunit delta